MPYKAIAVATCLFLTMFVHSAAASLVNGDWKSVGDNLITLDTNTGLEWLDITETTSLSFNEVTTHLSVGGTFEGWRYATANELASLWDSAGGDSSLYSAGWNAVNDGLTLVIGSFTGFTRVGAGTPGSLEIFGLTAESPATGSHYAALLWDNEGVSGNVGLDYTKLDWAALQDDSSDTPIGSWLVRDAAVPTPPAALLFLSGLGVLGYTRRQKHAANRV